MGWWCGTQAKPWLAMLEFHLQSVSSMVAALLLFQHTAKATGKAAKMAHIPGTLPLTRDLGIVPGCQKLPQCHSAFQVNR